LCLYITANFSRDLFRRQTQAVAETSGFPELNSIAEGRLVQAQEDKEAVMLQFELLSSYNAQLHQRCDFVNKEIRQGAMRPKR